MRRIISYILTACIIICSTNISFSYSENNDIVITSPVITAGLTDERIETPVTGLNSVSAYILNNTNSTVNIELSAVISTGREYFITSKIMPGDSKRLTLGFNIKTAAETVAFSIKNTETGYEYTDFEDIPINEEFVISYTNAEDDFIIDNDIVFEFNSLINETGSIKLMQNGMPIGCKQSILQHDGKTTLTIIPEITLLADAIVSISLPEIKDIFGRVMESKEIRFNTIEIGDKYSIYQKATVYSQAGIGGFSVLADFENNTPEKVYFSRQTIVPATEWYLPFAATAAALVIDPDGNIAATYDFSEMPTGKRNIVIDIPYAKEGIWQFKFSSAREGDILEIALPGAKNWGVRGETALGVSETTPKSSYIYVPEKVNTLYIGTSGEAASVYNENNELQLTTEPVSDAVFAQSEGRVENIEGESVLRLDIPENFDDGIVVDYAPSLMCPTAEMAWNLKGGWMDADGVLVQGSTQKAMREYLVNYIENNNFDIDYTAAPYERGTLENPEMEAVLFGPGGAVSGVEYYASLQNFDVSSPYLGSFVSSDTPTFEDGSFHVMHETAFSGLVNIDAQLNCFYEHEGLINRTAISIMASIVSLSEDMMIKDNAEARSYPLTHGNFYFSYVSESYMLIRDFLDEETKNIIDNAIILLSIKQGNMRGHGPTNQWLFTVVGSASSAYATENEILKGIFERHIEGLISGPKFSKGQSAAGYFIEGSGCDGDYHNLSRDLFFETYEIIQMNEPDNVYLPELKEMIQKNLEFNSLFILPQGNGSAFKTNAATARTLHDMGGDSHTTYTKIMDEFPLAKRRWELFGSLNTEAKAHDRLWKYARREDVGGSTNKKNSGDVIEFEAYRNVKDAQSSLLPFEEESGIWEKPGIIAVKHKDLFMNIFYTVPELTTLPEMSFMGGGMSLLWAEGVDSVLASRKHENYSDIVGYDQVKANCIFGKKSDGSVFVTGKEKAELTWIEDNKKFKISGTTPDGISVSWIYTLTDTGIKCDIEASGDTDEMWVNIPISKGNTDAVLTHSAGRLKYAYGGSFVTFDWSKVNDYTIAEFSDMRALRLKLQNGKASLNIRHNTVASSDDIEVVSYDLTEGLGDNFKIVEAYGEEKLKGIEVSVRNNSEKPRSVTLIYAVYSKDGRLISLMTDFAELRESSEASLNAGIVLPEAAGEIKVMIWENLDSLRGYGMTKIQI